MELFDEVGVDGIQRFFVRWLEFLDANQDVTKLKFLEGERITILSSEELGGILNDVCGLQVLKSGNFVVSCYGNQAEDGLKLIEITPDKKIVWTYQNQTVKYVHNLHVLSTNGQPE